MAEEERVSTEVTARVTASSFGKYRPLERLGTGGMADVFLALATGPFDAKKLVVLKQPRSLAGDSVHMFLDEARLAMRLNHPNIVQTYDVGVQDGVFFLAMEYLEGQPLHRILSRLAQANTRVGDADHLHMARIASDALAGLHYAHELADFDGSPLEIVHRDVSPHNLFVTYDGTVKVVDFGIAKATSNVVATESGVLKGKVAYMAPEHAASGAVDRRSDIYSMGVVLWEMIAKKRLVKADTPAQLLNKVLTMEAPALSSVVPDVHPLLEVVVTRALQRDPDDRWPTALAMREALDAYIDTAPKKPRDTDLGERVATLFEDERAEMVAKVRAHAQASAAGSSPQLPPARDSARRESTASGVRTGMPVVTSTGPVEPPRRSPLVAIALVVSVISLGVALFVVVRGPAPAPTAPLVPAATAPPSPPPSALPPAPVAPSASTPTVSAVASATPAPPSVTAPSATVSPPRPLVAPPAASTPPVRPIETAFPR